MLDNRNDQWIDRFTAGLNTTFSQSDRASHRLSLGYDFSHQDLRSLFIPGGFFLEAAATTRTWDRRLGTLDYLGNYAFTPNEELRSTLSFGAQLVSDDLDWTVRSGGEFAGDVPTTPDEARSVDTLATQGSATTAGLFVQNVLVLGDRYFLTTGLRVDRHTTQGRSSGRLDPRVGLAWVASDEAFWPESLGALRVRAAYGQSSTAPSPFVQAVQYFGGSAPSDAAPGGVLKPESNSEWEVGLDAALLGGHLNLGFTRYVQTTRNALVPVTVDAESSPQRRELLNVGEVRNQGIELQFDAAVVSTSDWALDVGCGISTNHSEVLDLSGAERFNDETTVFLVGYPAPVSRGRRVADPDAVNGPWNPERYLTDEDGNLRLPLGAQLPTRFLTPSISVRIPGGIAIAARGEYRGGYVRFVSPVPVSRSVRSPLCAPYYVDAATSLTLRADTPDLWQERCTPRWPTTIGSTPTTSSCATSQRPCPSDSRGPIGSVTPCSPSASRIRSFSIRTSPSGMSRSRATTARTATEWALPIACRRRPLSRSACGSGSEHEATASDQRLVFQSLIGWKKALPNQRRRLAPTLTG
jgi:hypothetical protein